MSMSSRSDALTASCIPADRRAGSPPCRSVRLRGLLPLAAAGAMLAYGAAHPDIGECYLRSAAGLPCPLCGATSALGALAALQPARALALHAPVSILVAGFIVLGVRGAAGHGAGILPLCEARVFGGFWGWFWLVWHLCRLA